MGLFRRPRLLLIISLVLVSIVISHTILRFPFPPIQIKPDKLVSSLIPLGGAGHLNLTNTMLSSWIGFVVIVLLAYLATRKMGLIPRGLQNLIEAVLEWLYGIVESVAGPANARRFYPVVASIFIFVIINNWISLTPGFGTIGKIEPAKEVIKHVTEEKAKEADMDVGEAEQLFEAFLDLDESERAASADHVGKLIFEELENLDLHIYGKVGPFRVMPFALSDQKMSAAEYVELAHHDDLPEGKTIGFLVPYFRNANTALNTTLALALIAMFFVEFWGIRALGFFRYGARFINFGGFRNGIIAGFIDLFVGMLESISEVARVISFTFRLFGNMFAGEILIFVMMFLIPLGLAVPFYGLELFVGFIQAIIFAMLTLMFGAIAVMVHDHEEHTEEKRPVAEPRQSKAGETPETS